MERIAIFAALQWECAAVVRQVRQVERRRLGTYTVWRSLGPRREVVVVKTGMGMQRAAAAVGALGGIGSFARVVSTGCAGGLAPDLRPGDLAIATSIVCGDGPGVPTDAAERTRAHRAMTEAGLRGREGVVLCSPTPLVTAVAKRSAAAGGAIAVEMEGEPIAAGAAAAQVPFLSVRSVLDGVDHELNVPGTLIDGASGAVRPLAMAGYVATHPRVIGELLALQRMQRAARNSLERFFAQWLADEP